MEKIITPTLKKISLVFFALLIFLLTLSYIFSPYTGYDSGKIKSSVYIDMPCELAYDYLGDSDHARDWSVFVDFIETINGNEVGDGKVGSKRICYTNEDKTGFYWEEEVLKNIKNEYRQLSCYGFENLFISSPTLVTEQVYDPNANGCNLTFTLDYQEEPNFWQLLKIKYSAYRIKSIFDHNLANIKNEVLNDRP